MKKRYWAIPVVLACAAAGLAVFLTYTRGGETKDVFREKEALLREQVMTDGVKESLGEAPAGELGSAVFLSASDGTSRARVFLGTGEDLETAWNKAADAAATALRGAEPGPRWVKADVVYHIERLPAAELSKAVEQARSGFFRYGLSFDDGFHTALLEAELNGGEILDYEDGGVSLDNLNIYLKNAGREPLEALPEEYLVFGSVGWLCDEDGQVYQLDVSGLSYGRRAVRLIDRDYAEGLILNAVSFLKDQVKEDGSFIYGYYPRFDREIEGYNMLHHAGTVWSMLCGYRVMPDEALAEKIHLAVEYLLNQTGFDPEGRAFLIEADSGEVKLGGGALALIALTEYSEVFQTTEHLEDCRALGGGLISMLDPETGKFVHVLNTDLTIKDEFRSVYYDGEAAFALTRLYGLTGEQIWLDAAGMVVDRMIAEDYTEYKDHWVSYAMNEITKYVTDRPDYYTFALENAQKNLEDIYKQETTNHTYLELLMATFELYDRLLAGGGSADGFSLESLLATIYTRADRQLDGYFYPEYAMYMKNPQRILDTFMVRQDGCRVRIDDVQHNIGGLYLYCKNYDRLVDRGLLR